MPPEPHLHLVDPDSGEVYQEQCAGCRDWRARAEVFERDLEAAEKDLRNKRAQIRALKADRERERREYVKRQQVEDLFAFWQQATGHVRSKLSSDRFDAIRARLEEDYSEDDLRLAILGAAVAPYKGHDEIELVCRGGRKVEDFAKRAYFWGRENMG